MKSLSIFARVFVSALIGTFVCLSFGAYALEQAKEKDPGVLDRLEWSRNITITTSSKGSGKLTPTTADWSFSQPISRFEIKSVNADIKIIGTAGPSVIVRAKGKGEEGNLAKVSLEDEKLVIKADKNVKEAEITIEIPQSFELKGITIGTVSGDIEIENISVPELNFGTVSGDIESEKVFLNNFQGASVSGNFNFKELRELVPSKGSSRQDFAFNLKTVSGKIENTYPSDPAATNKIVINSVSGDIEIE